MAIRTYNEGNYVTVTAKFINSTGATTTPATVRYRMDCEATKKNMLDWTSITPASTLTFAIPGSLNILNNQRNLTERKVVTIEANWDSSTPYLDVVKYDVVNLQAITT